MTKQYVILRAFTPEGEPLEIWADQEESWAHVLPYYGDDQIKAAAVYFPEDARNVRVAGAVAIKGDTFLLEDQFEVKQ